MKNQVILQHACQLCLREFSGTKFYPENDKLCHRLNPSFQEFRDLMFITQCFRGIKTHHSWGSDGFLWDKDSLKTKMCSIMSIPRVPPSAYHRWYFILAVVCFETGASTIWLPWKVVQRIVRGPMSTSQSFIILSTQLQSMISYVHIDYAFFCVIHVEIM